MWCEQAFVHHMVRNGKIFYKITKRALISETGIITLAARPSYSLLAVWFDSYTWHSVHCRAPVSGFADWPSSHFASAEWPPLWHTPRAPGCSAHTSAKKHRHPFSFQKTNTLHMSQKWAVWCKSELYLSSDFLSEFISIFGPPCIGAVAVFDKGDISRCPGWYRGGGGIMGISKKKLLAPMLPWHHAKALWGQHRHRTVFFAESKAPSVCEVLLATQEGESGRHSQAGAASNNQLTKLN